VKRPNGVRSVLPPRHRDDHRLLPRRWSSTHKAWGLSEAACGDGPARYRQSAAGGHGTSALPRGRRHPSAGRPRGISQSVRRTVDAFKSQRFCHSMPASCNDGRSIFAAAQAPQRSPGLMSCRWRQSHSAFPADQLLLEELKRSITRHARLVIPGRSRPTPKGAGWQDPHPLARRHSRRPLPFQSGFKPIRQWPAASLKPGQAYKGQQSSTCHHPGSCTSLAWKAAIVFIPSIRLRGRHPTIPQQAIRCSRRSIPGSIGTSPVATSAGSFAGEAFARWVAIPWLRRSGAPLELGTAKSTARAKQFVQELSEAPATRHRQLDWISR